MKLYKTVDRIFHKLMRKSPGWQLGNKRTKKARYPVVKKGKTQHKKRTKKAA